MYYQNYEDYMRQVLGYSANNPNIYEGYNYRNQFGYEDTYALQKPEMCDLSDDEIRGCYPEVYHKVYPMVCKACETNNGPITKDLIERMTDEIYFAIEATNTVVNIQVETPREELNRSTANNSSRTQKTILKEEKKGSISNVVETRNSDSTTESRQRNSILRDLIKILILNNLFGNRPNRPRPPRPPFPGGPGHGRPPFPGNRPPMGPGGPNRPPMMQPRDYEDYLDF